MGCCSRYTFVCDYCKAEYPSARLCACGRTVFRKVRRNEEESEEKRQCSGVCKKGCEEKCKESCQKEGDEGHSLTGS